MKRGLSSRNPKPSLLNIHEAIEKQQTKAGKIYIPREVIEPKTEDKNNGLS